MKIYTEEMITTLKELYPTTKTSDLASLLGVSTLSVNRKANSLNLKKTKEYIIETARRNSLNPEHGGRKFLFKKGHISYNKGKKQTEYMSADVIERTKATRFQKGIFPHNGVAIGTESVHDGYIRVKIAMPNIWKFKHVMVWEQYNGKVPSGHNIQFKDGNRENCDINNLYCISRSDQLKNENSMYCKYPKELQLAIQAKGQLTRQINILTQKQ